MSALRPHDDTQPIPVVRGRHAAPKPRRTVGRWTAVAAREVGIVAAAVAVVVIAARLLFGQIAYVADDAMAPTLSPGERILVSPWGTPQAGDVILVSSREEWDVPADDAVVRVVAVGGQRVACCDESGGITVDGAPIEEPFVIGPTDQVTFDVIVPAGRVFVLTDDRSAARDSRAILDSAEGTVDLADVRGRVVAVVWPPRALGG
ncbi:MAG: signal peptidase I [Candidatus Nanopelagicales bacterium]